VSRRIPARVPTATARKPWRAAAAMGAAPTSDRCADCGLVAHVGRCPAAAPVEYSDTRQDECERHGRNGTPARPCSCASRRLVSDAPVTEAQRASEDRQRALVCFAGTEAAAAIEGDGRAADLARVRAAATARALAAGASEATADAAGAARWHDARFCPGGARVPSDGWPAARLSRAGAHPARVAPAAAPSISKGAKAAAVLRAARAVAARDAGCDRVSEGARRFADAFASAGSASARKAILRAAHGWARSAGCDPRAVKAYILAQRHTL
jgi:hypothetical protein